MSNNQRKAIDDLKYLKLLSKQYPTIATASTEIINLEAILNLPKGTEHFLSDIHGEYEPFVHVLKNASGMIKGKIEEVFGNSLLEKDKKSLATLIYYPERKLQLILKEVEDVDDWYKIILHRLIEVCRYCSSKYTRSKVRRALPADFAYIIEELLHEYGNEINKQQYYEKIITTIIDIGRANEFIIALANLIQRLVIDRLHIIGDIFDRGPRPDIILDTLMDYHSVDIQWGNHDMLWMGAATGVRACIANVLRISLRYANLDVIEDIYGINLLPLATFALNTYGSDKCKSFIPKIKQDSQCTEQEVELIAKMHKAITILQFKLEKEVVDRRPEFNLNNRLFLNNIDYEKGTVKLDGKEYKLNDTNFPTIDPKNPYKLTEEESILIDKLVYSFKNSDKLQRHIRFLFAKGSMYLKSNSALLFHGCIPLDEHGNFESMVLQGISYKGKQLLEKFDSIVREGYFGKPNSQEKLYGMDCMWYLWTGPVSPLFGRKKMKSFERYFIDDKSVHEEDKNMYYKLRENEDMCDMVLNEFNLNPAECRIINGHVPVKKKDGESPVKANGKLIVIDGGFSKAYQKQTGIAGYTLICNSNGLKLVAHEQFSSTEESIVKEKDILSSITIVERRQKRKTVGDTDIGAELKEQIADLKKLLVAYRKGFIKENR